MIMINVHLYSDCRDHLYHNHHLFKGSNEERVLGTKSKRRICHLQLSREGSGGVFLFRTLSFFIGIYRIKDHFEASFINEI